MAGGEALPAGARRLNAFQLLAQCLDVSALFEPADDLVTRHTRFTSRSPPGSIVAAIDRAAAAVGGRVELRGRGGDSADPRLRVHIPTAGLGGIRVGVDIWELMPGVQLVDLFKVSGSTGARAVHARARVTSGGSGRGGARRAALMRPCRPPTACAVEFYRWYSDLAGVLSPLMTRPPRAEARHPR